MYIKIITTGILLIILACKPELNKSKNSSKQDSQNKSTEINSINDSTIQTRFPLPENYKRTFEPQNSFASYLRNLPLKPVGSPVEYYDGSIKSNNEVYLAVVDLDIGQKNLHQCADAIMRLKAEYHWFQKEYTKIHFNFTNGFRVDYINWMKGDRIKVDGNKTKWEKNKVASSNSYTVFWNYMENIFMYAGTASLSKELKSIHWDDMKIGDVLIKGGYPGHAVIIVDMAEDKSSGEKIFALAQSYMPAQEIQILCNPSNPKSPWYSQRSSNEIITPEWAFQKNQLKRFQ